MHSDLPWTKLKSDTNLLMSDKQPSVSLRTNRMSSGFLSMSDNFTNGSDNVRDRPKFKGLYTMHYSVNFLFRQLRA